ncbi:biotin--[acetyl-CoA-carboxylase] ligase [Candidatus Dependentiae bacterium]|nr:biotin--[acetyl-CoA-carboxylase] ligase [Candidatus Dependentiae bacterium]
MQSIGSLILTQQICDNSMTWAREVLPIVQDGTVLIVRHLAQARGRQGRSWVLAEGQITHTIVLKPTLTPLSEQAFATLNMALIVGLWAPFQKYGVTLKWPNDLYLNNKKLGGILFENIWQENQLRGIIVGYSLNINNNCTQHEHLASIATSLSDETGKTFDLGLMQTEIFSSLSRFYATWQEGTYVEIFKLWRSVQGYIKKSLKVHTKDGILLEGIAQDVLPNGDLVLAVPASDRTIVISFAQVEEVII